MSISFKGRFFIKVLFFGSIIGIGAIFYSGNTYAAITLNNQNVPKDVQQSTYQACETSGLGTAEPEWISLAGNTLADGTYKHPIPITRSNI